MLSVPVLMSRTNGVLEVCGSTVEKQNITHLKVSYKLICTGAVKRIAM